MYNVFTENLMIKKKIIKKTEVSKKGRLDKYAAVANEVCLSFLRPVFCTRLESYWFCS